MSNQRILVVEDEPKIAEVLRDYLVQAGFRAVCLDRGDLVVAEIRRTPPVLILLDVMLPGLDGMEVCREIRKFTDVPVIMITARVEEIDRLIGLELGADDYVCKPFSPREVVARVKAVLRRAQRRPAESHYEVGSICLDCGTHEVTVESQPLNLTPSEFEILKVLMSRPNRVYSRGELLVVVQGHEVDGYERTIDSHVKNIRRKIAKHVPGEEVISTVYGVGYKFNRE